MNYITTNIRIPEDVYMEIKMQAARERSSIAEIIRNKISQRKTTKSKGKSMVSEMKKLAHENAKYLKGVNMTKALIQMRYEQ